METVSKELYSNIPPTKIRNRVEVFRTPSNIPFWHVIADYVFGKMIRNRFFSVAVKNEQSYENRNKDFATIYYAPHTNWWDGLLGYLMIHHVFKAKKFRVMIEEMNRFPLFKYIGAYPINKKSAQTSLESFKFTIDHVLNDKDCCLLIFPQGIIRPPYHRPEVFGSGLAYLVEKAVKLYGGVNLLPVAVNYCFLRQDRPEILVDFGDVKTITSIEYDRKQFTSLLAQDFERFCDKQLEDIGNANFEGYKYFYKNKLHWWKRIEKRLKDIGMKQAKRENK